MYPSSLRMRAISSLRREVGISTRSCSALLALRMRASMSATGSVSIASPARLGHAGDHALVRELAQADPAEAELLEDRARAAAAVATRVGARPELLRALLLDPKARLGHTLVLLPSCSVRREGEAEAAQERERLVVRLCGGRDRDVEAANLLDVVVVDLREDDLLLDPKRVVAAAVERARVETTEVADPRQRDRDE